MQSVALIDYGSGNLRSAEKALQKAAAEHAPGTTVLTTSDPAAVLAADRIVLPGVGAFAACINALRARPGLAEAVTEAVRGKGAPFLGVCVGMQLLAGHSTEFGQTPGLGWIAGEVRRLEPAGHQFKVPHMGWNGLDGGEAGAGALQGPLFAGLPAGTHMYFTHSFAFFPEDEADIAAWTDHGGRFTAAVVRDNMAGVQFHPEKSQAAGQRLLANFLEWRP
ncbi:imidazole glycerol phosphate synthase subunit HisH [Caulobacter sp. KR2-114]|uniref:imidazole glycerol phosphate synthase subunit HisH n=1 Tax=Caulobacter sp. KR2-114 TaxID=3400912 RepID=UPI003BFDE02C